MCVEWVAGERGLVGADKRTKKEMRGKRKRNKSLDDWKSKDFFFFFGVKLN